MILLDTVELDSLASKTLGSMILLDTVELDSAASKTPWGAPKNVTQHKRMKIRKYLFDQGASG